MCINIYILKLKTIVVSKGYITHYMLSKVVSYLSHFTSKRADYLSPQAMQIIHFSLHHRNLLS